MGAVSVGLGFRINTGGPNGTDCLRYIVGSQTTGKDYGCPDKLDDATADGPIMRHAECTDLSVGFPMAVQQKEVGNALITTSKRDAGLSGYRDASHQEHVRQPALYRRDSLWAEQFWCSPQVEDRRFQFACPLFDQRQVGSQEQRRPLTRRDHSACNFGRRFQW